MISDADLGRLTAGRWLLPLVALVGARQGARFAEMLSLGLSRSVLAASLAQLIEAGWLRRNPGHGHPLRPEYLLTATGRPIAAWCERVMVQRARLDLERHDLGRWSLPLLFELSKRERRFSELETRLSPVTPRALSLTLKQMSEVRLIHRIGDTLQLYALTHQGERFATPLLGCR